LGGLGFCVGVAVVWFLWCDDEAEEANADEEEEEDDDDDEPREMAIPSAEELPM
jgi:hypothetical protein